MRNWFQNLWSHRIQYVLGIFTAVTGLLEYVDGQTINIVGGFFGPTWGPIVAKSLQCAAGITIAIRAYQHSHGKTIQQQ